MRKLMVSLCVCALLLMGCPDAASTADKDTEEVQKNEAIEGAKERVQKKVDDEQERVDEVNSAMEE